jgi:glycine/D-amino acid oxidase-like deaminating enzyme
LSWSRHRLRDLAARAVALFPFLADVRAVRAYRGLRPATPDGLPIIGPDPWIGGLFHACGHDGSGVCLAPATGALTVRLLTSDPTTEFAPAGQGGPPDPFPFHPERFG